MPKIGDLQMDAAARLFKQADSKIRDGVKPEFSDTLKGIIDDVNQSQLASGKAVKEFVAGKDIDLHEVMALGEEAQISFQLLMEIRNKLVEAYQEVSRMPI
jgi:flagellar hook-basal body complex protein FliE